VGEARISDAPETPFSYDQIASAYAAHVDSAPYNALYERPAMMELLPDVGGASVVDAGCGPGWYAEQLARRGAQVTAFDASSAMVELARARLSSLGPDRATVLTADLTRPLPLPSGSYDGIVSSLVLHYLRDWDGALRELRRILRLDGWLLFSVGHPADDAVRLETKRYMATEWVEDYWKWAGRVCFYRRPLSAILNPVMAAGYRLVRVVEPGPTSAFREVRPDAYARLLERPAFLIVLAAAS
jgi:SAM-dependent methyltransferase